MFFHFVAALQVFDPAGGFPECGGEVRQFPLHGTGKTDRRPSERLKRFVVTVPPLGLRDDSAQRRRRHVGAVVRECVFNCFDSCAACGAVLLHQFQYPLLFGCTRGVLLGECRAFRGRAGRRLLRLRYLLRRRWSGWNGILREDYLAFRRLGR